jgi:CDP-diacylglycerol---serine O-phosphatidyltransferase
MVLRRRQRRQVRISALPLLHLVPNMLTILGLCAGLTSIRYALDGRYELAVALIGAAVVLDGLDGRSARMFNLTSKLGAQLDSLADFLSFGVAPAILVYLWTLHDVRGIGWALAMLFATGCALRLARFNTELELPDRPRWTYHFFTGIPAPAAAGLAVLPLMMSFVAGDGWSRSWFLNAVLMVFVGVMMVSRVPTFSIKRVRVEPHMVLPTLLLAFVIIAGLVVETWLTLSLVGLLYLGSIPLAVLSARRMRRREVVPAAAAGGGVTPAAEGAEDTAAAQPAERVVSLGPRQQPQQRPR